MPDQWGRPTFDDGLKIARTVRYFQNVAEEDKQRAAEQDAYKVADAIAKGENISKFSPQSRYMGAKLHWGTQFDKLRAETEKMRMSNEFMEQKMNKLKLNLATAGEKLREYRSARAIGDDERARDVAIRLNNDNMYNGRYVQKDPSGALEVTNWDGSTQKIRDMPMEDIDMFIGSYFDKPYDEIMQWQVSGESQRAKRNIERLQEAVPYINEETGQVIYRVSGVWGPDGKPMPAFFVDNPINQKIIPNDQAKNFTKMELAEQKAGIMKKRKEIGQPDIVSKSNVVTRGDKQGVLVAGPGGAKFREIPGGLDVSGKKDMTPKQDLDYKIKQLETLLQPFKEKGKLAFQWNEGEDLFTQTDTGQNALTAAQSIVRRADQDPGSLSSTDQQNVENARAALELWRSIAGGIRKQHGIKLQTKPTKNQRSLQPPEGFVLD